MAMNMKTTIMMMMMMMMMASSWRPPRGGERAQRDTAPKLIVIDFVEIQNWGRCR